MLFPLTLVLLATTPSHLPSTTVAPAVPSVAVDSTLPLSVSVLTQMTAFWTSFKREPDSIVGTGRQHHQETLALTAGSRKLSLQAVNMVAMAKQYPSVATDLKRAGLTALQWEQYRASLYTAMLAEATGDTAKATAAAAKNVTFLKTNQNAVQALHQAGMWFPPMTAHTQVLHMTQDPTFNMMGGGGTPDDDLNP